MKIEAADFEDAQILDLLRTHLAGMHANSPPEHVFALDLSGLRSPDVSFYAAWEGPALLGFGALKHLSARTGEIKSMRTHPGHLRKGVGANLLTHLISVARTRAYESLALETGSGPAFEPAIALYRRFGFVQTGAFGTYTESAFSQFFRLDLLGRVRG